MSTKTSIWLLILFCCIIITIQSCKNNQKHPLVEKANNSLSEPDKKSDLSINVEKKDENKKITLPDSIISLFSDSIHIYKKPVLEYKLYFLFDQFNEEGERFGDRILLEGIGFEKEPINDEYAINEELKYIYAYRFCYDISEFYCYEIIGNEENLSMQIYESNDKDKLVFEKYNFGVTNNLKFTRDDFYLDIMRVYYIYLYKREQLFFRGYVVSLGCT